MSRAYRDTVREGCLVLVSRCPIELARFEGITQRWSVVSVLLGAIAPEDVVTLVASSGHTIIAALEKDASTFVLSLKEDVIRSVTGVCLVGEDIQILYRAAINDYHGDLVLLTTANTTPEVLAKTRRRFSGLRHVVKDGPDSVRRELRDLISRSVAAPPPRSRIPFIGWR